MRANGGDATERQWRKVVAELTSVTDILVMIVPGRTCELQQKQQSSSDGCSEGSLVGRLSEASMRGPIELNLSINREAFTSTDSCLTSLGVSPRHKSGKTISIAV